MVAVGDENLVTDVLSYEYSCCCCTDNGATLLTTSKRRVLYTIQYNNWPLVAHVYDLLIDLDWRRGKCRPV